MSAFLSNKFLKYRGPAPAPEIIQTDRPCVDCGYNLRSLKFGGKCPECGQIIRKSSAAVDVLAGAELATRRKVACGLLLIAGCPLAAVALRLIYSGAWGLTRGEVELPMYLFAALCICIVWTVGVWLATSPSLNLPSPFLRRIRLAARWMQFLWITRYILWLLSETTFRNTNSGGTMMAVSWMIALGTVAAAFMLALWLMTLAENAELDDAHRHIATALWFAPLPSLLVAALPLELLWFVFIISLIIIGPWAWYLLVFSRGVMELQRHVAWSIKLTVDDRGERAGRIKRTRDAMTKSVDAVVRPLPQAGSAMHDVPLNATDSPPSTSRPC